MDIERPSTKRRRPPGLGRATVALGAVLLLSPAVSAPAVADTGRPRLLATTSAPRLEPPTVKVGVLPFGIAINHRTGSLYVADQSGLALIDAMTCNAQVIRGCARTPVAVAAGRGGIGIVLSEVTNTVYVANGDDNTVSVIDGAVCNAKFAAGCASAHPAVPVGPTPSHLALDSGTDTLYVAIEGGSEVSMINTSSCNGHATSGCRLVAPTVPTGGAPNGLAIDSRTHTLYVSNGADNTVSVIDITTCNAHIQIGCSSAAPTVRLASPSVGGALDEATHTLFEPTASTPTGGGLGGLSIIDTARCNAQVHTGCSRAPRRIGLGSGPIDVAVNALTRRAYVVNESDSDVSVVDITRCNALRADGCQAVSPTMRIGYNGGGVAVDATTDTIYATGQYGGTMTVLDGATCNRHRSTGCRHPAPTTAVGADPVGSALSQATGTLYVANRGANTVSVIDTSVCKATSLAGCRRPWPTVAVGQEPVSVVADDDLGTLYVANMTSSTVSVINTRTCNARVTQGCDEALATIAVSGGAFALAIDPLTQTMYVSNIDGDTVSVINALTCSADITTGCGQTPLAVRAGVGPARLVLDHATHTLYIANQNAVSLLDTATCNASTSLGCSISRVSVPLVASPGFMAIEARTATLYVSIEDTASLAMIDTTRCNARITAGCGSVPGTVKVGYLPLGVAIDDRSGEVFVSNVGDSTVSVIDGTRCNAVTTVACGRPAPTVDTGGQPLGLTVDAGSGTLYVADAADAAVSIVSMGHLRHPRS